MTTYAAQLVDALAEMSSRFVSLARAAPPDVRVPATPEWTVTDVVGHVAMEPKRYLELAQGRGAWPRRVTDLPEFNAHQIAGLPTRDIRELTGLLEEHIQQLSEAAAGYGDAPPTMSFDGDQRVPADRQLGTLLGELVVHGHDIAAATGHDWRIDPAMVPLIFLGLHQVLPGWVDPDTAAGHTATYEMRLRGSQSYVYEFTDGQLRIDPATPRRYDVHISSEPVTALLSSYGRVSRLRPALAGKVAVWGRRPWLALTLRTRFLSA